MNEYLLRCNIKIKKEGKMENSKIISIEGLIKWFPIGGGKFTALNDINLTFGKGEFTGVVGPSGSGKTTLLNIIGSLDVPSKGKTKVLLLLLGMGAKERKKAVMDALEWVGLTDKIKSRPAQLSGGECQRVAVARAMVKKPIIVLADEPTANLDSENSHNILQTMEKMNSELKTTFIFATHDDKVKKYLHRKVSLLDGKVSKDELVKKAGNG